MQRVAATNTHTVPLNRLALTQFKLVAKELLLMMIWILGSLLILPYGMLHGEISSWRKRVSLLLPTTIWPQRKYLLPLITNLHEFFAPHLFLSFLYKKKRRAY